MYKYCIFEYLQLEISLAASGFYNDNISPFYDLSHLETIYFKNNKIHSSHSKLFFTVKIGHKFHRKFIKQNQRRDWQNKRKNYKKEISSQKNCNRGNMEKNSRRNQYRGVLF